MSLKNKITSICTYICDIRACYIIYYVCCRNLIFYGTSVEKEGIV